MGTQLVLSFAKRYFFNLSNALNSKHNSQTIRILSPYRNISLFSFVFILKYNENMSTSSKIVYTKTYRSGFYGEYITTTYYSFSRDRKTMTVTEGDYYRRTAVRIFKEDILPHRRERSMNNGILYE